MLSRDDAIRIAKEIVYDYLSDPDFRDVYEREDYALVEATEDEYTAVYELVLEIQDEFKRLLNQIDFEKLSEE